MARSKKENIFMEREKQNYLVNPVFDNPFEVFTTPRKRILAETDTHGRFRKVVSLSKSKRHHKAKKITKKQASKLLAKAKKITKKSVIKKIKTIKRNIKKHSKRGKSKVWTKTNWLTYKSLLKHAGMRPTKREMALAKKHNVNPLLVVGNPIRSKYMKRSRRGHRNPMFNLIKERQGKELVNLAVDGGLIVGGTLIGKFAMDKLSEKLTFLQKPIGKIGGHFVLGSVVYILGSKIKKIPNRITRLLALGVMLPAVVDVVDMVKSKMSGVHEIGVDEGNPYLPETSAYIPETSSYVPETSELVDENY